MVDVLQILGYFSLFLVISGVIGNTIIGLVSIKSKSNSTFVLFRYLAFSDTLSLFFWNLNHFIQSTFHIDIQNVNIYSCKIGSWIQFSSLQSSAWILVLISIDRYLIFKIKNWKKVYFTQGIASIFGFVLTSFFFLVNSNVLVTFGYKFESNGTMITQCFATIPSTKWMSIWNNVHSYLYSFIPFTLLAIINIFLIIDLQQKKRSITTVNSRIRKKQISINLSVILMTLLFIVLTSPGAICSQFYNTLIVSYSGNVILFSSDCIAFSYHALNILILCISNKHFLRKLQQALKIVNVSGAGQLSNTVSRTTKFNNNNNIY